MKLKNLMTVAVLVNFFFLLFLTPSLFAQATTEAGAAAGNITEQHKMLARSSGTWTGEASVWFAADQPPITSTSVCTNYMHSNGLFQISEIKGNVTGGGKPFTGVRITGYDPERKVFTRAMIQDGSPGVVMEGKWDEATRSFSMPFKQTDRSGKEKSLKEVYTFVDDDTEILEIYNTNPGGGKEARFLKVVWRRKK